MTTCRACGTARLIHNAWHISTEGIDRAHLPDAVDKAAFRDSMHPELLVLSAMLFCIVAIIAKIRLSDTICKYTLRGVRTVRFVTQGG